MKVAIRMVVRRGEDYREVRVVGEVELHVCLEDSSEPLELEEQRRAKGLIMDVVDLTAKGEAR